MGDTRDAYTDVENVFLPVGVGVFVLVALAILTLVVLGRRRREPSRRKNNVPLELAIVAVLAVAAGTLVTVSFSAEDRVGEARASAPLKVRVVAAKWRWRFEYPAQGKVVQGGDGEAPALVVPAGTPVEIEGVSLDVVHAFWVPELRFQRQLFPNRPTRFVMTFPEPGILPGGRCSMFCGLRHQDMHFVVDVRPAAEFETWVSAR